MQFMTRLYLWCDFCLEVNSSYNAVTAVFTGHITETHQYAVTEYMLPINDMEGKTPSIDFNYDLSPIVVSINDHPPSLLHFVVRMCAVVGGAFAVTRECRCLSKKSPQQP